jgi:radical SAM superfamily enzyme YgiQ (UPF0313 family)
MPSLGLLTVAGATPEEHSLTYLECPELEVTELDRTAFDLVAISSFTAKAHVMYAIADYYRNRGVLVVIGGLHCTLMPIEATEHADAVMVGEGEVLWPRILQDAARGKLRSLYSNTSSRDVDLADSPLPRYDLLDMDQYNRIPVQTTRGCPLHCEFCAASRIYGAYKLKPIERVVRDLRAIKALWKHPFIELADDNTFVNKRWSKELVRAIADENVRWFTETDISVADDPELLSLLAQSGCRQLLIGLESPKRASLEGLDAGNWKLRQYDQYLEAIDRIQSYGISVNGCFILGLDQDTPDVFTDVERFVKRSGLTEAQVTVLTPFPGTALYQRLRSEWRLLRDRYWDRCTLFDVNFRPKGMTVEELEDGLEYLMGALYTRAETQRRKRLYLQRVRKLKEVA